MASYDFTGWATKNNLRCSDGRIICQDAFKDNDGSRVPLVWNHTHSSISDVLGHADLENRPEGVYARCSFNDTKAGQDAKLAVKHGDVTALSIFANRLRQNGAEVIHGAIREVSLVLAGANPGAMIDNIIMHGEECDDQAYIYTDEAIVIHSEDDENIEEEIKESSDDEEDSEDDELEHSNDGENMDDDKTLAEVLDTLNEEQKLAVNAIVGEALMQDPAELDYDEDEEMKHNLFDEEEETLVHSEDLSPIFDDAKRMGSLRESFLAHADDYGIADIEYLFPDARTIESTPDFIKREDEWVSTVMSATHHTPFSRIKSIHADITEDEARAKGYIKGNLKKEEVFSLLKRTTTPTTIYKKQKLDRDDVIDITDFDVVAWIKTEMRMMLNEEIARAILVGDGRLASDNDHINDTNIRPIWTDSELYTINAVVDKGADDDETAKNFIRKAIKVRKDYKGSGNPVLFTTEDILTDMLLLEDKIGHTIYKDQSELATKLRVSKIVTVSVMEGLTRTVNVDGLEQTRELIGIIVNLSDYNVGADKGGELSMFEDFDIDYNQQKYLIETRCSGALVKPYSAIALECVKAEG